jgi:hypothetical protein
MNGISDTPPTTCLLLSAGSKFQGGICDEGDAGNPDNVFYKKNKGISQADDLQLLEINIQGKKDQGSILQYKEKIPDLFFPFLCPRSKIFRDGRYRVGLIDDLPFF